VKVLLTGGAGYIGSHTALVLLEAGHDVVVVDNLSNSNAEALRRVGELTGQDPTLHEVDLRDRAGLEAVFTEERPDSVVHFAGLKAVGESVAEPLRYYDNNVAGTVALLEVMQRHDVRDLVFSSSATVYGDPPTVPITESTRLDATNPYGRTKLVIEQLLGDVAASEPGRWRMALLRYFNPVGAHPSGRIGEDPAGVPNNLMPFVMQVAVGRRDEVGVFGDDYPTPDGTGVRDYLHVMDLAEGHRAALDAIAAGRIEGAVPVNLGTGQGHSVLEVIAATEQAVGKPIPHRVTARRPGDIATCFADPSLAASLLGWRATRTLAEMCADSWRWQSQNPNGYRQTSDTLSD
jgi:UDP-glucose 4-epimerase